MSRYLLGPRPVTLRSTARDVARGVVDESEQSQCRYEAHRAHDTERYRAEYERLVGRRSQGSGRDGRGHGGITDRAQRMAENGEALKYIELVLRQLRRASRDHQELVRQRHADVQYEISKRIKERIWHHHHYHPHPHHRDGCDSIDASRTWSRSSSSPWESDLTLRKSRPDVTTRLLTKRRDYGGTAQSTVDILKPAPGRVRDGITATAYQEMKYIPENVGSKDARETFGAWDLPGPSSGNARRTSSTVV